MDKKHGSARSSKSSVQSPSSTPAEADSGSAREGSENRGVYVNERGEVCYGSECVTLAVDPERREVRVNIKRSGPCDVNTLVQALRETFDKGASKTVYEVENEEAK
jgi:hypothetical protein